MPVLDISQGPAMNISRSNVVVPITRDRTKLQISATVLTIAPKEFST